MAWTPTATAGSTSSCRWTARGTRAAACRPGHRRQPVPNTTTTAPLPTGWDTQQRGLRLQSRIQPFGGCAVSNLNDPHYGPSTVNPTTGTPIDLTGDGKRDIHQLARTLADICSPRQTVPVDPATASMVRAGPPACRASTRTRRSAVSLHPDPARPDQQRRPQRGASYDKNATFAALGCLHRRMSASAVAASARLDITDSMAGVPTGR